MFASETAQRNLKLTQFADGVLTKAIDFLCVAVTHLLYMIVCVCPVWKIKEPSCRNAEDPAYGGENVSVHVTDTGYRIFWLHGGVQQER